MRGTAWACLGRRDLSGPAAPSRTAPRHTLPPGTTSGAAARTAGIAEAERDRYILNYKSKGE